MPWLVIRFPHLKLTHVSLYPCGDNDFFKIVLVLMQGGRAHVAQAGPEFLILLPLPTTGIIGMSHHTQL